MMAPLVSAIITTCGRPRLVGRAIESVLGQSYGALECIVVNDGSDEATRMVLVEFQRRFPGLRILEVGPQSGLSAARNAGVAAARGELVAFLDDDDVWLKTKIEKQVAVLQSKDAKCGLVYTWFEFRKEDRVVEARRPALAGRIFGQMIVSQPIGNGSTLLLRTEAVRSVEGFDVTLARGIDGDFIRRLSLEWSVDFVPEVLTWLYVGHEYERITTDDVTGLTRSLTSHQVKLKKFGSLLERYPTETAELYSVIALHHAKLGQPLQALHNLHRAVALDPVHAPIWHNSLRVVRHSLLPKKHALPV